MEISLICILILSILNVILFYGKSLGINVILFIIPIIIFIYNIIKKNIKNKSGLLFIIPIILLSISYLLYDNELFKLLNVICIPALFILMYIYTLKPTEKLTEILNDSVYLAIEPLNQIKTLYKTIKEIINNKLKNTKINTKKIKSIIIVIPIIIVVLFLLISADLMFENLFTNAFKIFENIKIEIIIGKILAIIILFTYLGGTIIYLSKYKEIKRIQNKPLKVDNYTIKLLLTVLNIIYLVFDIIQIKSLVFHQVSMDITYAEYARRGFFQLMIISIINITILLISKQSKEYNKYIKSMSIIMIVFTLIIIASSFMRMYMYENAYGYTIARLLVYIILITEVILIIPTIIYIFKKINILKYYLIITITMYTIINLLPIDYFIARNNINRYYKTGKIDVEYLKNYNYDNIPLLVELNENLEEKESLKEYLIEIKNQEKTNIIEYNISKQKAYKALEKIK